MWQELTFTWRPCPCMEGEQLRVSGYRGFQILRPCAAQLWRDTDSYLLFLFAGIQQAAWRTHLTVVIYTPSSVIPET